MALTTAEEDQPKIAIIGPSADVTGFGTKIGQKAGDRHLAVRLARGWRSVWSVWSAHCRSEREMADEEEVEFKLALVEAPEFEDALDQFPAPFPMNASADDALPGAEDAAAYVEAAHSDTFGRDVAAGAAKWQDAGEVLKADDEEEGGLLTLSPAVPQKAHSRSTQPMPSRCFQRTRPRRTLRRWRRSLTCPPCSVS
jgi:hypothetical protein